MLLRLLAGLLLSVSAFAQETPETQAPSGGTVVVATRHAPPFAIREGQGENAVWSGIAIDLWNGVAARLGLRTQFVEKSLADQLSALSAGEVDAVAGALTMTAEREQQFDFAHPFLDSGLGIATVEGEDGGLASALSAFPLSDLLGLLGLLLGSLAVTGGLMWFFERRANPDQFGGGMKGFLNGVWWSAVTMTTVGYGDKAPISPGGRLVGVVWMFTALFAVAAFTASMASTLTADRLTTAVQGYDDLRNVPVGVVSSSTAETALLEDEIRTRGFEDLEGAVAALKEGRIKAIVYDKPILEYRVTQPGGDSLIVLPETFSPQRYAIAFPEDSANRESVNREVLRLTGSATWADTLRRYLGD